MKFAAIAFVALAGCVSTQPAVKRPPFTAWVLHSGRSMLPTFDTEEGIELEFCPYSELRSGETVVFWNEWAGAYYHHRLLYRDVTGGWITKGDNNASEDPGTMRAYEFVARARKVKR